MTNIQNDTMRTLADGECDRVSGARADMVTTMAVGEEDGGGGFVVTKAMGEDDGWATTMAVGEEDGSGLPIALDAKIHR